MVNLALNPMVPEPIVHSFGLVGVFLVLFAETGLLVGFFLPGDSLLFLVGVVSAGTASGFAGIHLPLLALLIGCPISATLGAQSGYYLGVKAGNRISSGKHQVRLERAKIYFARLGPAKSIVLARFIGIVRTFINPAAGILGVPARRFLLWNSIGAVVWTDGVVLAGYFAGHVLPMDQYLTPITIGIFILATLPGLVGVLRVRNAPPVTIASADVPVLLDVAGTEPAESETALPEPV